jgi:hypothetical protein
VEWSFAFDIVLFESGLGASSFPTTSPDREGLPTTSSCLGPPGPWWQIDVPLSQHVLAGSALERSRPASLRWLASGCPHKDSDDGSSCRRANDINRGCRHHDSASSECWPCHLHERSSEGGVGSLTSCLVGGPSSLS